MPSSVPTVLHDRLAEPPQDWRERILRVLASEGVTQPPYVPAWRLFVVNMAKIVGMEFLGVLPTMAVMFAIPYLSGRAFLLLLIGSLIADVIIHVCLLARLKDTGRRMRVEWGGSNPTHAVSVSRDAPIFYLRAFTFDKVAAVLPRWGGLSAEEILIRRMRRYAPVLAIATPNENEVGLGALRFHVTDARWEAVVKEIVPCCRLVVWVTGGSRGLNWEIEHLVSSLAPHRLLLWPSANAETAKTFRQDWKVTARQRDAEWQQFVDAHADVFPQPLPRDITDIRFVAFDADWTPIPIPSARYPARSYAFIDPKRLTAGLHAFLEEAYGRNRK
jgi:hypothetical protein